MQVSATTPSTPAPAPGMAAGHADDGAFAALLSGHAEAPAPAPSPATQRSEAVNAAARRAEAQKSSRQKSEAADPQHAKTAPKNAAQGAEAGDKTHEAEAAEPVEEAETPADEQPVLDPALLEWLAALNRPAAAPGAAHARAAGDAAATTGEQVQGARRLLWRDAPGLAGTAQAAAQNAALTGGDAKQALDIAALVRDAAGTATAAAADEAPLAALLLEATAAPGESARMPDSLAALVATSAVGGERGAAAPLAVTVRTPATAPEFREALATQVSVLARDGVQQARLHLNPAEMGPISVQIALHGTQAQVNFGADSAATRDILQAGLPELAAALSQAGLTLTGGGVSQHARGGSHENTPGGQAGDGLGGDADALDPVAAAQHERSSLRAALGGVDLFA